MTSDRHRPSASAPAQLVEACAAGDADTVRALLAAGANPNLPAVIAYDGVPTQTHPLLAAVAFAGRARPGGESARGQSSRLLRLLLAAGADPAPCERQLVEAIGITGNGPALGVLYARDALPARHAYPLLALAMMYHHPQLITLLGEFGVDPNSTDSGGNTPLHQICSGQLPFFHDFFWHAAPDKQIWHLERIRALAAVGIDLDARDRVGSTALMRAIVSGQLPLARALIEAGADLDCQLRNGVVALHLAARCTNQSFLHVLMKKNPSRHDLLRMALRQTQPDVKALLATYMRSSAAPPPDNEQTVDRRA